MLYSAGPSAHSDMIKYRISICLRDLSVIGTNMHNEVSWLFLYYGPVYTEITVQRYAYVGRAILENLKEQVQLILPFLVHKMVEKYLDADISLLLEKYFQAHTSCSPLLLQWLSADTFLTCYSTNLWELFEFLDGTNTCRCVSVHICS